MGHLNEIGKRVFMTAVRKGWWDGATRTPRSDDIHIAHGMVMSRPEIVAQLALVTTEVSEAVECIRDDDLEPRESKERPGKPEGLPSELADIILRVAQLADALGIDLDAAIESKMAYNETRKHRHGGRKL